MDENSADFMDLKLSPGQLLQLEFEGYMGERDKSVLVGYRRHASILVTTPIGRTAKVGEKLNVRFFYGRLSSACAFQSEVLHTTKLPFAHMHIRIPESVVVGEVRQNVRADVEVVARVDYTLKGDKQTTTAKIVDLSLNGARILGRKFEFDSGDEILLIFKINVTEIEYEITVQATVRSVSTIDKGLAVGLQFHDLPANDKIALQAFVLTHVHDL
ncbi:MAG: flagellar brake protein [Gammaproteobacteria bacterium]|nr:flagellar brake protein [Gammaproteobacteria bacterium]